jgi:hypothetical protein
MQYDLDGYTQFGSEAALQSGTRLYYESAFLRLLAPIIVNNIKLQERTANKAKIQGIRRIVGVSSKS